MKWVKYLVVASGVLLVAQFAGTSRAYAASDYDNLIQNTSDLKVTYSGHSDLDVSSDYMSYFRDAITSDTQYNCSADGVNTTDPTNCNSIIDDSFDHGDWFISQDGTSALTTVGGVFCDQKISSIVGNTYTVGSTTYKALYARAATSATCAYATMSYALFTTGIHLSVGVQVHSYPSGTNLFDIGDSATNSLGITNDLYDYLFTSQAPYPDGYEGDYIPSEYTPPTPTTTLYTGTIDCGGEMPVAMSIYQPDNTGAADLTQLSLGRAQWSYNLTSDPYSFTVDCGDGKLATPYGAVDPASASNDWMCDIQSTEPYHCVLS